MCSSSQNSSMKKLITAVVSVSLLSLGISPAVATQEPSIVIIDSGFNTSTIAGNVVQEVCITTSSGCNNGTNFQIGPGAAQTTATVAPRFASDWNHGTLMAQTAIATNPDINLILIRNARVLSSGSVFFGGEASLEAALAWVRDNASTYNIAGVSMSRGSNTYVMNNAVATKQLTYLQVYSRQLEKMDNRPQFASSITAFTKRYNDARSVMNALPDIACPASANLSSLVTQLTQRNIASFFATGNDYNTRYVDSPACLNDAVAVTAASANGRVLPLANVAPNTDFAAVAPNTSTATAIVAAKWSLVYNGNYQTTYNSIKNSGRALDSYSVVGVN
jgi:hypothetical protein